MKKIIIVSIACVLATFIGCKPVNPPLSEDTTAKIIDICFRSMGNPPASYLDELAEIGYGLSPYELSEMDKRLIDVGYSLEKGNLALGIGCRNDSVLYFNYYYNMDHITYPEGLQEFFKVEDATFSCAWDYWRGSCTKVRGHSFLDKSQYEVAKQEWDSCANATKDHNFGVSTRFERKIGEKYVMCGCSYEAYKYGGMDPNTYEGIGKWAEGQVHVDFIVVNEHSNIFDHM